MGKTAVFTRYGSHSKTSISKTKIPKESVREVPLLQRESIKLHSFAKFVTSQVPFASLVRRENEFRVFFLFWCLKF